MLNETRFDSRLEQAEEMRERFQILKNDTKRLFEHLRGIVMQSHQQLQTQTKDIERFETQIEQLRNSHLQK